MTAPASGRDDATVRGAIVLVVAIVIGLALLARGGGDGGDDEADATTTTAAVTTTAPADGSGDQTTVSVGGDTSSTSVPSETLAPADVLVAVLNATETVGWADDNAQTLIAAGYETVAANPREGSNADVSVVYATPEAQANAEAVKNLLNLPQATISQKPAEPLARNGEDADAQIVVVLGADSVTGG